MSDEVLQIVENIIGYTFNDKELLKCALTYKSYVNEHGGESNGRLEYLGDSVLNLVVTEYLYRSDCGDEGKLTELRKSIVSAAPLAEAVKNMGLVEYCRLGKGAQKELTHFGGKPISDVFESVLGAIYLDGGLEAARAFVHAKLL